MAKGILKMIEFPDIPLIIGGASVGALPGCSSYKVNKEDVDNNSKRSTNGYMFRNRVRKNVTSVSASWNELTESQLKAILDACEPDEFRVIVFDPASETRYTEITKAYAGANKTYEMVRKVDNNGYSKWSLSISLISY